MMVALRLVVLTLVIVVAASLSGNAPGPRSQMVSVVYAVPIAPEPALRANEVGGLSFSESVNEQARPVNPAMNFSGTTVRLWISFNYYDYDARSRPRVRYVIRANGDLWLLVTETFVHAAAYGVLRGMTLGLWEVALDATWPAYFGRRHLGSIRGRTFGAEIVGAAIGPLPFGLLYDLLGNYTAAIAGVLILPLAAVVGVLMAFPPGVPAISEAPDQVDGSLGTGEARR